MRKRDEELITWRRRRLRALRPPLAIAAFLSLCAIAFWIAPLEAFNSFKRTLKSGNSLSMDCTRLSTERSQTFWRPEKNRRAAGNTLPAFG